MHTMNVLVMGLTGCGKTTLSKELAKVLATAGICVEYFNADLVRHWSGDFDFSMEGRTRQAVRMKTLCDSSTATIRIADFICPTEKLRELFSPDFIVWVNTPNDNMYPDTNMIFEAPKDADVIVTSKELGDWLSEISSQICEKYFHKNEKSCLHPARDGV